MTATFNDRDGVLDPTAVDYISRPLAWAVRNPVTDTWHPRFRGAVDDHTYDLDPSGFVKGTVVARGRRRARLLLKFSLASEPERRRASRRSSADADGRVRVL